MDQDKFDFSDVKKQMVIAKKNLDDNLKEQAKLEKQKQELQAKIDELKAREKKYESFMKMYNSAFEAFTKSYNKAMDDLGEELEVPGKRRAKPKAKKTEDTSADFELDDIVEETETTAKAE